MSNPKLPPLKYPGFPDRANIDVKPQYWRPPVANATSIDCMVENAIAVSIFNFSGATLTVDNYLPILTTPAGVQVVPFEFAVDFPYLINHTFKLANPAGTPLNCLVIILKPSYLC